MLKYGFVKLMSPPGVLHGDEAALEGADVPSVLTHVTSGSKLVLIAPGRPRVVTIAMMPGFKLRKV